MSMMHFVTASDEFSLDIRVICKVTLSSPCRWAFGFHPYTLFSVVPAKQGKFIESQYEIMKLSI
jgi:hypothetical protein